MRFSGASPPRAPRPRSPGRAAARSARTRAVGPGGGNPPSGLRLLLDRGLERQLLLGGEQPRGVEDDDRAAVLHDEPRDVVSREPLDEAGRRGDLGGGELQDLGDGVDHDADVAAVPLEDHGARLLAVRRRHAEPLAQVDERHRGALVLQHALEEVGCLGERRRRLVAEDPLHLEDVEREVLTGHLEGDELDVVACGHPMRSPSASRSRIGTSTPRRRATALAQGSAASRTTSSASSTSNATWRMPSPAPISTSTAARPRPAGAGRSPISAPRWTSGTNRPRRGVSPRIAGRASGRPYALPSTRTNR